PRDRVDRQARRGEEGRALSIARTAPLLRVAAAAPLRDALVAFLTHQLGTDSLDRAKSYLDDPSTDDGPRAHEHARVSDRLARRRRYFLRYSASVTASPHSIVPP